MRSLLSSLPKAKTLQQKLNYQLGQAIAPILGAVRPEQQAKLPRDYAFDAHVFYQRFASTHYGIMIPDLPEPFRYLSFASVIGDVGTPMTRTPKALTDIAPANTATLVHGTALSNAEDAFHIYDVEKELMFSQTPFRVDFAEDASLYEQAGQYFLDSKTADLEVHLTLTPTPAITWFSHSALYQHFSILMRYEGSIEQQGQRIEVSGLCTLEHWKSVATSMLPEFLVNDQLLLPLDTFSYHVIDLDQERQLVLAYIGFAGQPLYTSVSYRHVDGTSIQYDGEVSFEVTALKADPLFTPDGAVMEVPQAFRWVAHHEGELVLDIMGVVDTPYCYGLAAGYVSSYQWSGEFNGEKKLGRGYVEYIDRR